MKMKKIFGFVAVCLVVGALIGVSLPPLFPSEERFLKEDAGNVLAGLVGCIFADQCTLKRTVEDVQGRQVLGLYQKLPEKGLNIKYALQVEAGALTVIVALDANNQLSITDTDLDGLADAVIEVSNGVAVTFGPLDPAHLLDYNAAQQLYEFALQTAWDKLVPPKLQQHLRDNPDVERFRG
jgi:hypothetical protein